MFRTNQPLSPRALGLALFLTGGTLSAQAAASFGPVEGAPEPKDAASPASLQWGDFDGDGLDDALGLTADGRVGLQRNLGDGLFEDATELAGLSGIAGATLAIFQDYDLDGRVDLFLGTARGAAYLLQNRGGTFEDVTPGSGIDAAGFDRSAHWIDYDGDGQLDLHLVTGARNAMYHALGDGRFEVIALPSLGLATAGASRASRADATELARRDETSTDAPGSVETELVVTPGGRVSVTTPNSQQMAAAAGLSCVTSLVDTNGGGCVQASTAGELGMLYPLSETLFVDDALGHVGLGTTTPSAELHVQGSGFFGEDSGGLGSAAGRGIRLFMDPFFDQGNVYAYDYEAGASLDLLLQTAGGRVGVGLAPGEVPASALDVDGAITIRGGADIVERFESSCGAIEAGTVVAIDPENPGRLMCSKEAYDAKVAGVVSGAGGVNPGLCLGQDGVLDGDTPVAMTGRVYVKCSTENGFIRPGDRLTTATLEGHAMKATNDLRAPGCVIGKAMSSLDEATGLVLVLVNLQ